MLTNIGTYVDKCNNVPSFFQNLRRAAKKRKLVEAIGAKIIDLTVDVLRQRPSVSNAKKVDIEFARTIVPVGR